MVKVDMREVFTAREQLSRSVSVTKDSLASAKGTTRVIVGSGALKGQVKTAINNELSNYTLPILNAYQQASSALLSDYTNLINNFQSTVQEFNSSAVIDTEALSTLNTSVSKSKNNIDKAVKSANRAISDVADIINLGKLSSASVNSATKAAQKKLKEVTKNMNAFNGASPEDSFSEVMTSIGSSLSKVSSTVSVAEAYHSMANRKIFSSKKYRRQLSTAIKAAEKAQTKYRAATNKELRKSYAALDKEARKAVGQSIVNAAFNFKVDYDNMKKSVPISVLSSTNEVIKGLGSFNRDLVRFTKKSGKYSSNTALASVHLIWNKVSSTKSISNLIKKGKLSSSLADNLYRASHLKYVGALKKTAVGKTIIKSWKYAGIAAHPVKAGIKRFEKTLRTLSTDELNHTLQTKIRKLSLKSIGQSLSDSKIDHVKSLWNRKYAGGLRWVGKHGKIIGKVANKGGMAGSVVVSGVETASAYFDRHNKQTYHNIGHSLVHVGVDTLKNAGPVEGMIVGAELGAVGGPFTAAFLGATLGVAGAFNWAYGKFRPNSKDKSFKKVENTIDIFVDNSKKVIGAR